MSSINYLKDWFSLINEIDPSTDRHQENARRVDGQDQELGVLDDYMQRYWLFLEGLGERIDSGIQKLDELRNCFSVDKEKFGNSISQEKIDECSNKINAVLAEVRPSAFAYKVNLDVFSEMLKEAFPTPDDRPVLGIRTGYKVVCRRHDSRGDGRNKLIEFTHSVRLMVRELSGVESLFDQFAAIISRMKEGEGLEGTTPEPATASASAAPVPAEPVAK